MTIVARDDVGHGQAAPVPDPHAELRARYRALLEHAWGGDEEECEGGDESEVHDGAGGPAGALTRVLSFRGAMRRRPRAGAGGA